MSGTEVPSGGSTVIPSNVAVLVLDCFETLVELVRGCGFDLPLELVAYDTTVDGRLEKNVLLSPERRVSRMLARLERGSDG